MNQKSSGNHHLEELEELTARAEARGLQSLPGEDALRLGQLYRQAASSLSRRRMIGGNQAELDRLNRLVGRAYQQVYATPKRDGNAFDFLTREIPQAIRSNYKFIIVSFLAMMIGACVAGFKVQKDPASAEAILGQGAIPMMDQIVERHQNKEVVIEEDERSVTGAFILGNNVKVSLLAFAWGVLFGLGSLYIMVFNGAMLGALAVAVSQAGAGLDFWEFVAAHGVPELTAIIFSGAAGLRLGWSLVDPGEYRRSESLRLAAYDVIRIVLCVALMLCWAAVLEAFVSPNRSLPYSLKFTIAGMEAIAMVLFFTMSGRTNAEEERAAIALRQYGGGGRKL